MWEVCIRQFLNRFHSSLNNFLILSNNILYFVCVCVFFFVVFFFILTTNFLIHQCSHINQFVVGLINPTYSNKDIKFFSEFILINSQLKLASAIFYQFFIFSPNDSPSKTIKSVFYFIEKALFVLDIFKFL